MSQWLGPTAALTCSAPKPFRGGPGSPPRLTPDSLDLGLCNLLPSRRGPGEVRGRVTLAYIHGLEARPSSDIIPLMPNPAKESGAPASHPGQSRERAGRSRRKGEVL